MFNLTLRILQLVFHFADTRCLNVSIIPPEDDLLRVETGWSYVCS